VLRFSRAEQQGWGSERSFSRSPCSERPFSLTALFRANSLAHRLSPARLVPCDPGHTKHQYLCVTIALVDDFNAYGRMIPIFSQQGRLLGLEPMDWLVLVAGIACAGVLAAALAY
jgi:hypothetical protein